MPAPGYESLSGEGADLARVIALSDGIFAFAMTLLVVNLVLPTAATGESDLGAYLNGHLPQLLDYVLAFLIVAAWWSTHHRTFSVIRRYDSTLLRLNTLFLLLISVTPFMLALVFAFGPTGLFSTATSARLAVALFSGVQVATGIVALAIWRQATGDHRLVDADLPAEWIRFAEVQGLWRIGIMAAALLVGLALPTFGQIVWFGALVNRRRLDRSAPSRAA